MQKLRSMTVFLSVLVSLLALGLNGCGSKGKQGPPGEVAVAITAEAPGANCAEGGQKVDFQDEAGMVISTMYVCDGTDGESVTVTAEAAGSNCPNAGVMVEYLGISSYVCNGANGATGADGSDGADGIGVVVTPIAAGGVCGTVTGINVKLNDVADTGSNICNGVKGDTGSQGPQGVTGPVGPEGDSVILTPIAAGGACGAGISGVNVKLEGDTGAGTDVCNGAKGDQGDPGTSVVVTPIAAGGICGTETGINVKLDNGVDTGSDICNGTNGTNGISILWLGESDGAPVACDTAHLNNAYYDSGDGASYVCDGSAWGLMAKDGSDRLPYVIHSYPIDAEEEVDRDIVIQVVFNKEMDPATIDDSTFRVTYGGGFYPVTGVVSCSGRLATFTPNAELARLREYTVTVGAGVSDLEGVPMGYDHVFSFVSDRELWEIAELIETDNAGNAKYPHMAVDLMGNAIAVWYQSDGTRNNIWSNRYDAASGAWSTAELIETDNAGSAYSPKVAVDPDGNVIAVWYQSDGTRNNIWSNRYDAASGAWGTASLIETNNSGNAGVPEVAVDPEGNAIAVWYQYDGTRNSVWSNRYDAASGAWGTAGLIETDNAEDAYPPLVAVDPEGNAIAVWYQYDGTRTNIWSNRYDAASGAWGTAELIETDTGDANYQQVAVDPEGNAIAVWLQYDGTRWNIWSNRYDAASGAWGTAELIETDNAGHAAYPQVAVDPDGNAIAVWDQSDGTRLNIYSNRYDAASGAWGTASLIETNNSGNAEVPELAVDPDGNVIVVWQQSDGTRDNIWANRYDAASGAWGTAELIETDNAGHAAYSQVAVDPDGNAIAVWHQSDGTRDNIWANRFD